MAQPAKYYPNPRRLQTNLHDEFRRVLDQVYALQDQLKATQAAHDATKAELAQHKKVVAASASKVNGLNVKAVPPADGQTLKYVAKTGEIEWS